MLPIYSTQWRGYGLAGLLMLTAASAESAKPLEVIAGYQHELLSEPEPLDATIDDWGEAFQTGERQWIVADAELGFRVGGVEVAFQQRAVVDLRFNADAAEFYGRTDRNEPLTPGEEVPVAIRANGFSAQGLRLGYRHQAENWTLGASGSVLQASHLISGTIDGRFVATSENDYDFNAAVDYQYYRDPIFERADIEKADGLGWAFQVAGDWQVSEHLRIAAEAKDLFAKIRWEDAPYTEAQALSERKRYDEEGYAVFDPFLSGVEGYRDVYYQDLDPRYGAEIELTAGNWSAYVEGKHQFGYGFAGYGAGYHFGSDVTVKALTWPDLDAASVSIDVGRFTAGLTLDSTSREEAHVFNLTLAYGY